MLRATVVSVALVGLGAVAFHAAGRPPSVQAPPPPPAQVLADAPAAGQAPAAVPAIASHDLAPRALVDRYCVTCHNATRRTAGLMLDVANLEDVGHDAVLWEKVVRKLRARQMPPAGVRRPDQPTLDAFVGWLETELDGAAADPKPGRSAAHRLNRAEYQNAIRDLLALDTNVAAMLPADDAADFDNIAEILSVSPLLVERYLSVARTVSRLAVGNPTITPDIATYELPGALVQSTRMSEDLPFGSRGGLAVRHHFPLDGNYIVKVRLQRTSDLGLVKGVAEPQRLDVRLDGARVKLFTFGGESIGKAEAARGADALSPSPEQSEYERLADGGLELRFNVRAGTRLVQVTFLDERWAPEDAFRSREAMGSSVDVNPIYARAWVPPAVASVAISGPFDAAGGGDTASRQRIFVCRPTGTADEEPCVTRILSMLARRAYRRPVTDADIQPLRSLYGAARENGFEAGVERALRGILVSTEFLFRVKEDPPDVKAGVAYRLSDIDLASRLSFFLWSSIPDEELLSLAERQRLKDPAVLQAQVKRMLADSRSYALVENFAGQWLYLRNLDRVNPSRDVFPGFDENLRHAFRRETELFFESMLREDRPVVDLLRADYSYVNERLARHYGIADVHGSRFRRVQIADEARRGLLGHGSILTVTSYPNRTSPVIRGKWVLENLLGLPPPPPPDNIPALKDKDDGGKALSMRGQMEQHRANPTCAVCHKLMDPIGFALDNFNAVGQWRTEDEGEPIDATGTLPDGSKVDGPATLRRALLANSDQFVHTVAEKLLTYAVGRGMEHYDQPHIRKILREAAVSGDVRWSSLIQGIVSSTPFQMRSSR